ncbi:GH1 family beta-glucosidase [Nakamurella alba]|uniref:GH1 family beta-glucosidase n=1 Tax=Nakamurella alba TaxID=2665158 RepID=UPI00389951AD
MEGAVAEGGRGPSIWDTFSHTPGKVLGGDTGDVADDHYHRWAEDIGHIKDLGLKAYRFSIAWPRVQPGGRGEFNAEGIAFYSTLVDALLAAGIEPVVTLYHWDLPQELEDEGGWTNRQTAYLFAEYARRMAQELGDRISVWTTLNEPWCAAYLGYASGVHAPGRTDGAAALAAAHHLNLAHGLAGAAVREVLGADTKVSVTLNLHVTHPVDPDSAADRAAVAKIDDVGNEVFLGPMLEGAYPQSLLDNTSHVTDWSFVHDGDLALIRIPLSILGVNYYSSSRARFYDGTGERQQADGHGDGAGSPWVGCEDVEFLPQPGPYTAMGWNIDPDAFRDLLVRIGRRFPDTPLMVTENGAAFDDEVAPDGAVHDENRIDYLRRHFTAALDALEQGIDLRGYFVWSLLDNFEWSFGYERRFGIIRVDYDTQLRTPKDSALWYREVVRTGTIG